MSAAFTCAKKKTTPPDTAGGNSTLLCPIRATLDGAVAVRCVCVTSTRFARCNLRSFFVSPNGIGNFFFVTYKK